MTTRLQDWPARLDALIEQRRCMTFAWGTHDCCQFARAAVRELRGRDPAEGRKLDLTRYRTEAGARKLLERLGGVVALPERCGLISIDVRLARRGDLVCHTFPAGATLGVCLGRDAAFPAARGLVFIATLECERAWRV